MRKQCLCFLTALLCTIQLLAQPTISSFSPVSGSIGATITINGTNFSSNPADNIVHFGAVRATVTAATPTALTVIVPPGATYAPLSVTTGQLMACTAQPFAVTFPEGGSITGNSFTDGLAADTISAGSYDTRGLAIADLDGDGRSDIAVVDRDNSTLSIFKNTSATTTLSLAPKLDYPTGQNPIFLAAGDLDGDGKFDLVVCNSNSNDNTLSVYKNTSTAGTISFAPPQTFAAGPQPMAVAITDLNGDGKPDLAIANIELPGCVSILKNTTTAGVISFASRTAIPITGAFSNIGAADLDGDGRQDLVVTDVVLNALSIVRNTTTGNNLSFAAPQAFATGLFPSGLSIGDLDGDGKPDVATANLNSNSVTVFRNTSSPGNISLVAKMHIGSLESANDVSISDVDGDAKPDLLVCNKISTTGYGVSILKNISTTGNPWFLSEINYGAIWGDKVSAADLDGDGKPDLVISGSVLRAIIYRNQVGAPDIAWFTPSTANTGTMVTITGSRFTGATAVSFGGVPASSFTVVNAGSIQAVVGAGASGNVSVTTPYGKAVVPGFVFMPPPAITSFQPATAGTGSAVTITGSNFTGATAVSFGGMPATSFTVNSSTSIIAVVGAGTSGNITITTPGGASSLNGFTYVPPPAISSFTPAGGGMATVVTITGNNFTGATSVSFGGTPALAFTVNSSTTITATVAGGSTGAVQVTTPYGSASLPGFSFNAAAPPVVSSVNPHQDSVGTTVVIDGSNFNAIAAQNIVYFGPVQATVLSGTTTRLTCSVPPGSIYAPVSVTNTATSLAGYSPRPFHTIFSGGPIQYGWHQDFPAGGTGFPKNLSLGDLDGDGKLDVVVANGNTSAGSISVLRNTSTANTLSFDTISFAVAFSASDVAVADFDGDGRPDIAVCSYYPSTLTLFRNTGSAGNISFAPRVEFSTGYSPTSMATGDIDGDGRADIVTANNFAGSVSVFRNTGMNGVISFAAKADYPAGSGPTGVCLGDFDGDGKLDIAASVANDHTVSLFRNTGSAGTIAFAARVNFPTGSGPSSIAAGDLDGDGRPDIAVTNGNENTISVLRNTGLAGTTSFASKINYPSTYVVLSQQKKIAINDLDGDGKPDLAVANYIDPGSLGVYRNTGSPGSMGFSYLRASFFISGGNATGLAIGDMNRDGRPDLVVSLYFGSSVSIQLSQTSPAMTITVCPGSDTTFTSDVSGTSYRWQVDKGNGFEDLTNDSNHNYTGTNSLRLTNVPASFSGYLYRCRIDGINNSRVFSLSVPQAPAPTITAAGSAILCPGSTVALNSSAPSGNQWYLNGTAIPGATAAAYTATQAGNYSVTAPANGCASLPSAIVNIPAATAPATPSITTSPSATVCAGTTVTLTANATGCVSCTYSWNGAPPVTGPTTTVTAAGTYQVVVNNACGSATATQQVVVNPTVTPSITISAAGCQTNAISFTATAVNGGTVATIDWYVNHTLSGHGPSFTLQNAPNGAQVYAKLTSTASCASPQSVTSSTLSVNCTATALPNIDGVEAYGIAPNPTDGLFTITVKLNKTKPIRFEILDDMGRSIYTADAVKWAGVNSKQIDLRSEAQGLYFIKIFIGNKVLTEMIIIRR